MANPSILILAGDGIGPEVMAEVKKIIGWFKAKRGVTFDVSEDLVGGCAYDAHGTPLTDETMAKAQAAELKKACNLNLAAARLRTRDWKGAVTAADKVLEKDGLNAKALYRRAQARLALQDFVEAERDARVALAEDPSAADLRLLLARIKKEAAAYDKKEAKTFSNLFGRMWFLRYVFFKELLMEENIERTYC